MRRQPPDSSLPLGLHAQILDAIGEAVIATDLDGIIRYWNRRAEELYGWKAEEVLGRDVLDVTSPEPDRQQAAEIMETLRRGERWSGEFSVRRKDGTTLPARVVDAPIVDSEGELVGVVGVSSDLTESREMEERVRESQKLLETVITSFPIVLLALDAEGRFILSRGKGLKAVGIDAGEAVGWSAHEVYGELPFALPDGEVIQGSDVIQQVFEGAHVDAISEDQGRVFDNRFAPLRDASGHIVGLMGVALDVTERARAEEALRRSREGLRELARRLQTVRDDERTALAREIHDDLGQHLAGLSMDLAFVRRELRDVPSAVSDTLCRMEGEIRRLLRLARQIASELRPRLLADLGLQEALVSLATDFQERAGIACHLAFEGDAEKIDESPVALAFLRIAQEAMTNVARHAEAENLWIRLDATGPEAILEIRDDGVGPGTGRPSDRGLGILGMEERAVAVGGRLSVTAHSAGGTLVRAIAAATG